MVIGTLVTCATICLSGCGSDKAAEGDTTTAAVTENNNKTTEPKTEPKTEEQTVADSRVVYTIKVVDEEGNVLPSVMVQICKDACVPGVTNDQGIAEFKVDEDPEYKASIMQMPEGYELAGEEKNFYFESGSKDITITLKKSN